MKTINDFIISESNGSFENMNKDMENLSDDFATIVKDYLEDEDNEDFTDKEIIEDSILKLLELIDSNFKDEEKEYFRNGVKAFVNSNK